MSDRILQVRLPPDLKQRLDEFVAGMQTRDLRATESEAVRYLLRAGLAAAGLGAATDGDAGFNEGLRRGYSEARAAIREAMEKFFCEERTS